MGAVIAIAIGALAFVLLQPGTGPMRPVPLLVGKTFNQAREVASGQNFLVDRSTEQSDDPAGTVIGQHPVPGGFLAQRTTIHLVVSTGPKPVAIPDVVNQPKDAAIALLQGQFAVDPVEETSRTVRAGLVIRTEPKRLAAPDSTVRLVVSKGPPLVEVPDVAGKTYDDAAAELARRKLTAARAPDEFSDTVAPGLVIRTDPPALGQAPEQSAVKVVVSKGPDLVVVPDFKGKTIEQVTAIAAAAGVQVQTSGVISAGHKARAQDVDAGTKVKRAAIITVFF
jgi:serine/threonine-protein kinase